MNASTPSMVTDALAVIVSEETGAISLAVGGTIERDLTVEQLRAYLREHWLRIKEELLAGDYCPQPVLKVEIPKPGSKGMRMLGIPTVVDRLIQQALHQVMQPLFEPEFSESSYGFRPGRRASPVDERRAAESEDRGQEGPNGRPLPLFRAPPPGSRPGRCP